MLCCQKQGVQRAYTVMLHTDISHKTPLKTYIFIKRYMT